MLTSLSRHIPAGQCFDTPSTRNSCFTFSRDTGFHTTMVMATEQPWSESGGLSRVERTGAASVSHTHSWHQWPQDKSGWRVAEVWSEDHWLGDQPVASTSGVMHSTRRRTLSIGCETADKTVHWPLITCNVNFACFSKLISHPSCFDVRLLCLKFHTNWHVFIEL